MGASPSEFSVTSSPIVDLAVVVVLLLVSAPILRRFLRDEPDAPWLARLLWVSLLLHIFGSFAQNWVVIHIYHGSADYVGYDSQGAMIAHQIKTGGFSLGSLHIPGNDMVGLTIGVLYLLITPDQLGSFLVFAWFAYLGLLGFHRAFRIVLPQADHRRYALMIFLMPSLLYWPSAAGKEAVMTATLGLSVYGAARVFKHLRGGWVVTVLGIGLGSLYRPHESLLLAICFAVAVILRRSEKPSPLGPLRWLVTLAVVGGGVVVLSTVAASFLHLSSLSPSSVTNTLQQVNTNTVGHGQSTGFGSSHDYSWSPSLLDYPKDLYIVMLQPLPWQAHGFTQIVSALENVLIAGIVVFSWRRLKQVLRAIFREPYLMLAVLFFLGFVYVFSSLGNLGLLSREKVLMMPLLFVLLALPLPRPTPVSALLPRATARPDATQLLAAVER